MEINGCPEKEITIRTLHSNVSWEDLGFQHTIKSPSPPEKPKTDWNKNRKPLHLKVGKLFTMGRSQSENLRWLVLEISDGKALVISEKGLVSIQYHDSFIPTRWQDCSLKNWLNEQFFSNVFSEEEQSRICCSSETGDYLFIFSAAETWHFLPQKESRITYPTKFAVKQGAGYFKPTGGCWWWLRNSSDRASFAGCVDGSGQIHSNVYQVNHAGICIRPVMWISLE